MHVTDVRAYSLTVTESKSYSKYQSAHHGNGPWLMNINNRSHRAAALQPEPCCFVVWQLFKTLHLGFLCLSWGTFVLDIRERSHDLNLPALICTWVILFIAKPWSSRDKTTEEEGRIESLERPTLRSKVWKSWNILSPETCDREGGRGGGRRHSWLGHSAITEQLLWQWLINEELP